MPEIMAASFTELVLPFLLLAKVRQVSLCPLRLLYRSREVWDDPTSPRFRSLSAGIQL